MRQNGFHPSPPPEPTLSISTHILITTPIRLPSFHTYRLCPSPRPNSTDSPQPPPRAGTTLLRHAGSTIHTLPSRLQCYPSPILKKTQMT
ncbi:hypothetical protein E2C01_050865 [Portunus trituberculatus]|uniref:Uncharacterized protein n=1 Tax=Portunus trituberculatus TaxID=210409 RepID=A0A5B7GH89_PORTR|nr:hypothetical protein [Portunus trituberculatus]